MKNNSDLKNLSLQLYGKEVEITLVENSPSYKFYNTSILKGILIGRLWGDKKIADNGYENTVVAITLLQDDKKLEIPGNDIDLLE